MHEYTVIGHPRHKVIFFIAILSSLISNCISKYIHPWFQDYLTSSIVVTFTISGFAIFGALYFLFNHFLWKLAVFRKLFHFPNLAGTWECVGKSNNISLNKVTDWEGTIVVTQSWDKILVSLKTNNSTSQSMSIVGGIKYFSGVGYKLSYHYENTPNASEEELKKHEGFCILTFCEDTMTAEGYYFNNIKDRQSYGEMHLKRSEDS